jgi:hypothetical protein
MKFMRGNHCKVVVSRRGRALEREETHKGIGCF